MWQKSFSAEFQPTFPLLGTQYTASIKESASVTYELIEIAENADLVYLKYSTRICLEKLNNVNKKDTVDIQTRYLPEEC